MRNKEMDMKCLYKIMNNLINENKITFDYYNISIPLELLQVCYNKLDNTINLSFRDTQNEYINELSKLVEKIKKADDLQ